jgi:hypothetical protein
MQRAAHGVVAGVGQLDLEGLVVGEVVLLRDALRLLGRGRRGGEQARDGQNSGRQPRANIGDFLWITAASLASPAVHPVGVARPAAGSGDALDNSVLGLYSQL